MKILYSSIPRTKTPPNDLTPGSSEGCVGYVYKVENLVNKKLYMGKTTKDLLQRLREHACNTGNSYLTKAIHKHGIENFEISLIETCFGEAELSTREIYWIEFYGTYNNPAVG